MSDKAKGSEKETAGSGPRTVKLEIFHEVTLEEFALGNYPSDIGLKLSRATGGSLVEFFHFPLGGEMTLTR